MTHPSQTLSEQIERLVRQHIEATRRAAAEAVERACAAAAPPRQKASTPRRANTPAATRTFNGRRAPNELAELGERLYKAIVAEPGETMTVLAPAVGATVRELQRPMMRLKQDGRVRSVGQRHQMRYYPTAAGR